MRIRLGWLAAGARELFCSGLCDLHGLRQGYACMEQFAQPSCCLCGHAVLVAQGSHKHIGDWSCGGRSQSAEEPACGHTLFPIAAQHACRSRVGRLRGQRLGKGHARSEQLAQDQQRPHAHIRVPVAQERHAHLEHLAQVLGGRVHACPKQPAEDRQRLCAHVHVPVPQEGRACLEQDAQRLLVTSAPADRAHDGLVARR
mmetsp:Transcript_68816/g.190536  ORF Transcript_68816/g.190536 Transcript_68816/m.190536 type:complete len:200 (-) Transcript_68816:48-647(-)